MKMIVETENTIKVVNILKNLIDKRIIQKDIREFKKDFKDYDYGNFSGRVVELNDCIIVYLPEKCQETVFVHEIMHKVLVYEKYPYFSLIETTQQNDPNYYMYKGLESDLTSKIHHFELDRRMEQYFNLDVDCSNQLDQPLYLTLLDDFTDKSKKNKDMYNFFIQQLIVKCLDCFLMKKYGEQILDIFKGRFPYAYSFCSSLFKEINIKGFDTPEKMCLSAKHLKKSIIYYGERNWLKKEYNDIWKLFEIKNDAKPFK